MIKPNNGGQVIDLAWRFKAIVVQILRLAPAVRPVRQPEPTPSGSRGGAKFKIFARKIGPNKINGLGAAEIRCKDDRASPF